MKPFVETLIPEDGCSWAFLDRRLAGGIPFEWHHHPEFELTFTLNSRGHRYIGDDVSPYEDGDLVLIGPGIPHSWQSEGTDDAASPHVALVAWFTRDWMERLLAACPELGGIRWLLESGAGATVFSPAAAAAVRADLLALRSVAPAARLLLLLRVLARLAADTDAIPLPTGGAPPPAAFAHDPRMQRILDFLHRAYAEPVSVAAVADVACMSVSAAQRLFRRHTRLSIIDYVVKLRIGRACALLTHPAARIAQVAGAVGYGNLALFNRHFLRAKGMSPSAFRKQQALLAKQRTPA